jgi:hypothetical protein
MTRSVTRLHPDPIDDGGSQAPTLIDRYLGASGHSARVRFTDIPRHSPLASVTVEMIDTMNRPDPIATDLRAAALWHVLWIHDERGATVTIHGDTGRTWPVVPGDTVSVPGSMTLTTSGGQLGLAIRIDGATAPISPPTHGTERFFGHNRRTIAFQLDNVRVCRWKLTQSLDLAEYTATPVLVMALARSVIVRTHTSIDQLGQGDIAIVDTSARPILTPDGLAYLLTIDQLADPGVK